MAKKRDEVLVYSPIRLPLLYFVKHNINLYNFLNSPKYTFPFNHLSFMIVYAFKNSPNICTFIKINQFIRILF